MLRASIFSFCLFLLVSCGNKAEQASNSAPSTNTTEIVDGSEKTEIKLAITGMMCAHACGGKIQQDLQALQGVKGTTLDFVEDREQNVITVEIDPTKINLETLISTVNSIADGKYQVASSETVIHKI
jgi:periplasmic mercuric ion binding protein